MLRWLNRLLDRGAPSDRAARMQAAYALHAAGDLPAAQAAYRALLERDPDDSEALFLLGEIAHRLGRLDEAIALLHRAAVLSPRTSAFHRELGDACRASGDLARAEEAYRAVLALEPGDAEAQVALAAVSLKRGRPDEAERLVDAALSRAPDSFRAHMTRGEVLLERALPLEAAQCYRTALRLKPGSLRAVIAEGWAMETAGDVTQALERYERAVAMDPANPDAHVSRATMRLAYEDFERGWDEFEWRRRAPKNAPVHERFALPDWDGSPLAGRGVLFYAEQGLGDQIMYASCLPEILAQAERCVVDCDARLVALFRRSFPQAAIHGGSQSDPGGWIAQAGPLDVKLAAASAPRFFRRRADAFPRHQGYLKADPDKAAKWRNRLEALGPGIKVGLSWRGGVPRTGRSWRSLSLGQLLPVLREPGVQLVCLQYGDATAELEALIENQGVRVHYWPEAIEDYDETAALVCALDLTLTVCTAIVHLAGALGRPAWVMAPVKADARYGLSGPSMRWYPSVRMFRQPSFGDWQSVVHEVQRALQKELRPVK